MTITSGAAVSPDEGPDEVAARLVAQGSTAPVLVPTPVAGAAAGIAVTAAPVAAAAAAPVAAPVGRTTRGRPPTAASRATADAALGITVQRAPADAVASVSVDVEPEPAAQGLSARLRGLGRPAGPGLTSLGGVLLGALLVGSGTLLDLMRGPELGLGFAVAFVLASLLVVLTVRPAALASAVVLPPLLYAGARVVESQHSGQTRGRRELALDVATSLALHAPVLLVTSGVVVGLAVLRVLVHGVRRARA